MLNLLLLEEGKAKLMAAQVVLKENIVLEFCGEAWSHLIECHGRCSAVDVPWSTCRGPQSSLPG